MSFHALDLQILYLINGTWSRPWLDPIMARVSDFDSFRYPIIIAVVLTLIFGKFRGRLFLAMMAACLIIGDGGIDWGIKMSVNRPRPSETEWHVRTLNIRETGESEPRHVDKGRSFTSGHACNNVALAMMGCAIFGRWALCLWPWAALVSYSRIYVGAHYPTDILGSWVVAICYSYGILKTATWLWKKYAPGIWPQLYAAHPVLFPSWALRGWPHKMNVDMQKSLPLPILKEKPSEGNLPPAAWVTYSIVVSTAVMFLLQLAINYFRRDDVLGDAMAFSPDSLQEGRYWTLLTYAWAHAVAMYGHPWLFWLHVVSNMIPLICLGPALEDMLGHLRFLGLYVGGAITAALVWYLSDMRLDPSDGIIGASGAVFAVIAGIGTAVPREKVVVFLFYFLPIGTTMRWVALFIVGLEVVQVVFHWMPEMAHWAHLGGAAFGFIFTAVMLPRNREYHLAN